MAASDPKAERPAGPAPGERRARHKRWTRVAKWVTIGGVVLFLAFGAWAVRAMLTKPTPTESDVANARTLLHGIGTEVQGFWEKRGHLPRELKDLRDPELPSQFEALPRDNWNHPIGYRIVDEAKGEFRLRSYGPDGQPDTPDDIVWPAGKPWR